MPQIDISISPFRKVLRRFFAEFGSRPFIALIIIMIVIIEGEKRTDATFETNGSKILQIPAPMRTVTGSDASLEYLLREGIGRW